MRIVVVGGTGMVGRLVVSALQDQGHDVVAAAPETGVNTLTGEGLDEAFKDADAVLDVTNSPAYDRTGATAFFRTSCANQLEAERSAGVKHHVVLSIVGVDRDHTLGYYHAKLAQEEAVREGGIPFCIVRATQFFDFIKALADGAVDGDTARLPATLVQPLAVADLAQQLASIVTDAPTNDVIQVAGPQAFPLDEAARRIYAATGRTVTVVTDPEARPFMGEKMSERTLLPDPGARLTPTTLDSWLAGGPA